MENKPKGEQAGWRRLSTEYPFSCSMFRLRRDRLQLNDCQQADFTYIES